MSSRRSWILASVLGLSFAAGCTSSLRNRPLEPEPPVDVKQAKADFAAVTERYASAVVRGELSPPQCKELSAAFEAVYREHGEVMATAMFNAGAVWERCGDVDRAERIYQTLVAEVPDFALAYNNLGVIALQRQEESKALGFFNKAVEADPLCTAPRNNLAAALRRKYLRTPENRAFEAAEVHLQSVLAKDPTNQLAYENLARLYYDRGRLGDSSYLLLADLVVTQGMRTQQKAGEEPSGDLHNLRGLLFMQRGNQVDALRAFEQATSVAPGHADAHMNIAMISIRFRDYARARESLQIALRDPGHRQSVEGYLALGVAHRGLREYEKAEQAFERAAELRDDPRALYNLGILYHEHIGPSQSTFSKKPYQHAKRYFSEFVRDAHQSPTLEPSVTDAKLRVANIDQLFEDVAAMEKLAAEAQRLEALQEQQQAEDRKRRLELERKAKAAAGQ